MGFFQVRSFLQKVISGQTQPLSFGGIQQDGSDAKIVINADGTIDFNGTVNGISSPLSDDTPLMDSVGASGTSSETSRSDHVHPSDTTKANLSSPALTGTPTAPTAAEGTNTTQIATTAYVQTELSGFSGGQYLGTAATKAISYNSQTIAENITIGATQNAFSVGPITIADGYTVTIEDGGVWLIG